jgi:type IV pilus assembly protein PilM
MKYVAFTSSLRERDNPALRLWGDIDIPGNVLTRGQIENVPQLTAVLKEFKARTGAEFVRVSLPEERAYLFETTVRRDLSHREIRDALEFKLGENVPIPSRETYFDYNVLSHDENDRTARVAVIAYAREIIERYFEACVGAGLFPLSFEIEAQAMARAVVPKDSVETVMVVDFGKTRTGIGIVQRGVLLYTSTVDVGGKQLSEVLRKVHGDLPEEELTHIKNTQGLMRGNDDSRARDALMAIVSIVSIIRDEISSRLQYWHREETDPSDRRIARIVMCGGSANLKGLPEYLTDTLKIPCVRGNVWTNVCSFEDDIPPIELRYSYGYATAIGLALKRTV